MKGHNPYSVASDTNACLSMTKAVIGPSAIGPQSDAERMAAFIVALNLTKDRKVVVSGQGAISAKIAKLAVQSSVVMQP